MDMSEHVTPMNPWSQKNPNNSHLISHITTVLLAYLPPCLHVLAYMQQAHTNAAQRKNMFLTKQHSLITARYKNYNGF